MKFEISRADFNEDALDLFWRFVAERQRIWHRRFIERKAPPWTSDPVLSTTKFTNIYRELDPGTRYAIEAILETEYPKPDKVFNVLFYRLIGRAETHRDIGFLTLADFEPGRVARAMKHLRDVEGKSIFTAAYMVSGYTQMGSKDKVENVTRLFGKIHNSFDGISSRLFAARSAEEAFAVLRGINGFGNFLAYQSLVDLLYPLRVYGSKPLLPFTHDDWAQAGPGAKVGIRLLVGDGRDLSELSVMKWLRDNQQGEFKRLGIDFPYLVDQGRTTPISLANIQNCLCEYHKYVKIGNGTGRGRQRYIPSQGYQRSLESFGREEVFAHPARRVR